MSITSDDLVLKRSILLGARVRFSPSGASVREQAIKKVIEQNLASIQPGTGLTEGQLTELVTLEGNGAVLRAADVSLGLKMLKREGRVEIVYPGPTYRLSPIAQDDARQAIKTAEERTEKTVRELFGSALGGPQSYRAAFLRLLCIVFSRLSELYVQVIAVQQAAGLIEHQSLSGALEEVLKSESVPDQETFRYGVSRFFRETSPLFNEIKWNMAQNFYVVKALGIDSASDLLSVDILRDAFLYCDTNILIAGLLPSHQHYNRLQTLSTSCRNFGVNLKAAYATVEELRGVIASHAELLRSVIDRIPDSTIPKVRSFLLEAYLSEKERVPHLLLDDFIARFRAPIETLQASFGITVEDDSWFNTASDENETRVLAHELSRLYENRRGRIKVFWSAVHDAILLRWVSRENQARRKSWVLSLDVTLVEWSALHPDETFRVITLDALLQWMTPLASGSANEDKLTEIFSEAIRYQLLPRETFFTLRDFQVFAEMGIETKQLPAEDVEACIRELKRAAPGLDPSRAEDREKLGRIIQHHFADPGSKHKRNMQDLQDSQQTLIQQLVEEGQLRKKAEEEAGKFKLMSQELSEQIKREKEFREQAATKLKAIEEQIEREKKRQLLSSIVVRTIACGLLLVVLEGGVGWFAWKYGEGSNLFQRCVTASWVFAVVFSLIGLMYIFVMGRERLKLLKWWKAEE